MPKKTVTYSSDVEELIAKFRGSVKRALLNTAAQLTEDIRDSIKNTYDFQDPRVVDNYVTLKVNPLAQEASIRVIKRSFNLIRLKHIAPYPSEPGYTKVWFRQGLTANPKMFPIEFENGGKIMVTRSGIKHITERWQPRQSAMPFTAAKDFDDIVYREKETVFQTYERKEPRTHTFRIPRTLSTVDIVHSKLDSILKIVPENIMYELTAERPLWRKTKKKK